MLGYNIRCATQRGGTLEAGAASQAERSKRWRVGVTARLDEIKTELQQLGEQIEARLALLSDKLVQPEQERRH